MADPLGKILLRGARRLFIWPLEAELVLALYGIARLLPLPVASAVMGMLFSLVGPLTPWHGQARRNLNLAMPELDAAEQRRILAGMWRNFGRVIGEFPHVHRMIGLGGSFEGQSNLEGLENDANLIGAHIGNWELGPYAAFGVGHKVATIYRPLNNQLLSGLLESSRRITATFSARDARPRSAWSVRCARPGPVPLVDQQLAKACRCPFSAIRADIDQPCEAGHPQEGAADVYAHRTGGGSRFRITISPPIALPAEDDDATVIAVVTEINAEIERWIRAAPTSGSGRTAAGEKTCHIAETRTQTG